MRLSKQYFDCLSTLTIMCFQFSISLFFISFCFNLSQYLDFLHCCLLFLSDSDNHIHMISDLRIRADIHINWVKFISSMFFQFQESTDKTKIKNWTIFQIKTELKLDNNEYNIIYTVLKKELRKEKLLKLKLNTIVRKKKLKKILKNIMKEYSAFLHSNLSKKTERLCLKAFIQKCNNNQKC